MTKNGDGQNDYVIKGLQDGPKSKPQTFVYIVAVAIIFHGHILWKIYDKVSGH